MKVENLISNGYRIDNAKIESADLSMEEHGCLPLYLTLSGSGWGCVYGGARIGKGYVGAKEFKGAPSGIEYIMRIMDTVGVSRFSDLTGKYIRVAHFGLGRQVDIIGNVIDDKWFSGNEFFDTANQKVEPDKPNQRENDPMEIECTANIRRVEEATAAAVKLFETIEKAKTLIGELASLMDGLEFEVKL